ncbi:ArdC family protein [Streptomyces sp. NPDC127172]|uniref:ArdC family protein n=1 Tax=Streptomyces sp. NPDC127172 TaxID=3345382 RepID=UPI003624EBAA
MTTTATRRPRRSRRKEATPEEREAWRAAREEKVAGLKGQLDTAADGLTTGAAWATVLAGATRITRYSFRNVMLILQQFPEATQVAGYEDWKKYGRHVRKGEHAKIFILAPVTRKAEEGEDDQARKVVAMRGAAVYDISQTDPDEGADPAALTPTSATPAELRGRLETYAAALGHTVKVGPSDSVEDLLREVTHLAAGTAADTAEEDRRRIEAESAAFIVAGTVGLDVAPISPNDLAAWASRTEDPAKALQQAGQAAVDLARTILAALEPDEDTGEDA